jgi:hypothetical protein
MMAPALAFFHFAGFEAWNGHDLLLTKSFAKRRNDK